MKRKLLLGNEELDFKMTNGTYLYLDNEYIKYLKSKRKEIKRDILKKTVNIPAYRTKNLGVITDIPIKGLENIKILNYKYELQEDNGRLKGKGVVIGEELINFV